MSDGPKPHAVLRPGSRLWPLFELLRDRGAEGATTLELSEILVAREMRDFNISSSLSDIRKVCGEYGYVMLPAVPEGTQQVGSAKRRLYRYRVVSVGQALAQPAMASVASTPERRDLFGDSRPVKPR